MTVVKTLREVAASGRIVICSLHQPASGLLEIFHEVLLLSGGRVAFQGSSIDATNFFDRFDYLFIHILAQSLFQFFSKILERSRVYFVEFYYQCTGCQEIISTPSVR